jgi:hypothetical protein
MGPNLTAEFWLYSTLTWWGVRAYLKGTLVSLRVLKLNSTSLGWPVLSAATSIHPRLGDLVGLIA